MKIILMTCLLMLVGCGGGNFTAPTEVPQEPAPVEVVSAEITSVDIQYLYESHLYASTLHFQLNVQARNTGTVALFNSYYRIEGEDLRNLDPQRPTNWALYAVTMPADIYPGGAQSQSMEFTASPSVVYSCICSRVRPAAHRIKVTLCTADGTPLSDTIVTMLML